MNKYISQYSATLDSQFCKVAPETVSNKAKTDTCTVLFIEIT